MKRFNTLVIAAVVMGSHPARAAVIEAWMHTYSGPTNVSNQPAGMAFDASGNLIVARVSRDYYLTKYAAENGQLIWEKSPTGVGHFTLDSKGNVIVTGRSADSEYHECYTAKYAATDGALLWEKRHSAPGEKPYAEGIGVAVDAHDHIVVSGTESNGTNSLFYTAKYAAADGTLLWERHFSPPNNHGAPSGIALDRSGNVAVTGVFHTLNDASEAFKGSSHNYTVKYAAADGALLWEQHYYSRPVSSWADFHGPDIAVDQSGNVVIAEMHSNLDAGALGLYVAKYAAADGAVLWEKRPDARGNAGGQTVAVDSHGHVVALGKSYMAKYAASDGALIWERRYAERDPYLVSPASVAFDGNDNVLMTDTTWKIIANERVESGLYTAKYAGANGALLWEKRFEVPNLDRLPAIPRVDPFSPRLVLGPIGVAAISGTFSFSDSSDVSFAAVVYRENLPALSIEKVPAGIQLRFGGVGGQIYNMERATNVLGPWSNIATLTAPADGAIEHLDTALPSAGAYYRVSTAASP